MLTRALQKEFDKFYATHLDRVYRFVFFRVKMNKDVAEDLTSEIFMKALKHFAKYDPKRSQVAWIMTIARNHVINHYRDTKETCDVDELAFKLPGEDGRKVLESMNDTMLVQEAILQLKPKDRKIIEMKYLQGYRYKEIAEMLNKTAGAVRIESHRAMKKLRSILEKPYAVYRKTTKEAA